MQQPAIHRLELAEVGRLVHRVQRELHLFPRDGGPSNIMGGEEVAHVDALGNGEGWIRAGTPLSLLVDAAEGGVHERVERGAPQELELLKVRDRGDERVPHRSADGCVEQVHQGQ
jgi:hypothetical protein